jgi:hypothetical protein
MLKPYAQRVEATYQFISSLGQFAYKNNTTLLRQKRRATDEWKQKKKYELNFKLDTTLRETLVFKGYEAVTEPALIGTGERLRYDRAKPYEKEIPRFRNYQAQHIVELPQEYIIPQAWTEVIERLKWNNVLMKRIPKDTLLAVSGYYVGDVKTSTNCYEGHFAHQSCSVRKEKMNILFFEGDYIIPLSQDNIRYIATFVNPQCKTWTKRSLLKAYDHLLNFPRYSLSLLDFQEENKFDVITCLNVIDHFNDDDFKFVDFYAKIPIFLF